MTTTDISSGRGHRRGFATPTAKWVGVTALLVALVFQLSCHRRQEPAELTLPPPSPTQGYVGAQRCGSCHGPYVPAPVRGTYHEDWRQSAHGKTTDTAPSEQTIVADHDENGRNDFLDGLDLASLPEWRRYTTRGGATSDVAPMLGFGSGQYTITLGSRVFVIHSVLGIGRHQQTYLTRIQNSTYVLPVVYRVAEKKWQPLLPENWYTWNDTSRNGRVDDGEVITGLLYSSMVDSPVSRGRTADSWERSCAGCHVTGLTSVETNLNGEFIAKFSALGVGCEACHGPGRLHDLSLGGHGFPDHAIISPSHLSSDQHRDLCMSCHTQGESVGRVGGVTLAFPWRADGSPFAPGERLEEALTISTAPDDRVHRLQGSHTHGGLANSKHGIWSQDCQDCHSAHNTTNLSLVRSSVDTPVGIRDVSFTRRSGPPGSRGLMGDATDGEFSDVCEVCHTRTEYFRGNNSTPSRNHFNGQACTDCHLHSLGFLNTESPGGIDCKGCHGYLVGAMKNDDEVYRHALADSAPIYPTDPTHLRCLSCHVDHDVFRPSAGGSNGRGANLRTSIAVLPNKSSGFTNTDFLASGDGGICLSCHKKSLAKSYVRPDGSSRTPPIPFAADTASQVSAYAAGIHGGTYSVTSKFRDGGKSTFAANCSKCHNDNLDPKSGVHGQTGPNQFGTHASTRNGVLSPLGFAGTKEPMEEQFCYRCHSRIDDPIGGKRKPRANRDWYDVRPMSNRSEGIWSMRSKKFGHKVDTHSGGHTAAEGASPNWNPPGVRHVECADCHNLHATGPSRNFDTSGRFAQPTPAPTNLAVNTPLRGVWGVDVKWPKAWQTPDHNTAYTRVENSTHTWQVCLKCHSGYGYGKTLPAGETNQALEFNPNNPSFHAVIGKSVTSYPPNSSFVKPWKKTSTMSCSDCHTSDVKTEPQGPHGSAHSGVLAGAFDETTGQRGTESHLCFKCHSFDVYGRDGKAGASATGFSGNDDGPKNLHAMHMGRDNKQRKRKVTCVDCHTAVPHGWRRRAMLVVAEDPAPYNSGTAALRARDISKWPSSGSWRKSSCSSVACH